MKLSSLEIVQKLIGILDTYEDKTPLVSNQGQAMDGFSALAAFAALAENARKQDFDSAWI